LEAISRAFREQVQYYRAGSEKCGPTGGSPQHKLTFPFQTLTSGVALFSKKITAAEFVEYKSHRGDLVGEFLENQLKVVSIFG
jgi:hypothetical protein